MDNKIWILRIIADWTLILVSWWFLLNLWGWSAALLLAAYIILLIVTEIDLYNMKEQLVEKTGKTTFSKVNLYMLEDGTGFIGTSEEYATYLSRKLANQQKNEEEAKCQEDQQDQK